MKLRQPGTAPSTTFPTEPGAALWRASYHVTTLTPIYGGGVKAGHVDVTMPVRAAAIRGQLRFWWRLLQRHRRDRPITDDKTLFSLERSLWGGMAEEGRDYASKVRLRVRCVENVHKQSCNELLADPAVNVTVQSPPGGVNAYISR